MFRQRFNIHILHDSHSVYYFLRTVERTVAEVAFTDHLLTKCSLIGKAPAQELKMEVRTLLFRFLRKEEQWKK